jgi:hypothetical protein
LISGRSADQFVVEIRDVDGDSAGVALAVQAQLDDIIGQQFHHDRLAIMEEGVVGLAPEFFRLFGPDRAEYRDFSRQYPLGKYLSCDSWR